MGTVRFLVSPNRLHHLFLAEWKSAYPPAGLYAKFAVECQIPAFLRQARWRAPKRIFDAHPPDQDAQLRLDLRSPYALK